jgi:hypothetical protein
MLTPDAPPAPPAPEPAAVEVRLTAERTGIEAGRRMGMTGLHLLRPLGGLLGDSAFGGISVFGATQGDRGGFFGWGVTAGGRWSSGPWQAEAGLFAGGGGGSPGWVGGGLMLRPHAALGWRFNGATVSLGVAQLRFPNGSVHSTHPFASLDLTGLRLFGPPGGAAPVDGARWASQALQNETAATIGRYSMRKGSVRRDGLGSGPPLQHGGVLFRRDLPGRLAGLQPYWVLSTAGGLSAAYAGYAELLGGLGLRLDLPGTPLALRAEAALGSGGAGAAADTGGGGLAKVLVGASWQLGSALQLSALAGRTTSRGPFSANEHRIELAWRGWDVLPGQLRSNGAAPAALDWAPWTLAAGVIHQPRMLRDDGSQPALALTALRLEREVGPHWRLTGQAAIAITGNAGGYATGQLGLGWLTAADASGWRWGAAASLGAAGGGAVRVANGWVAEGQLIARRALSPQWALQADVGWLRGANGALSSPQLGLSAVFSFSRLQGQP